MPLWLAAAAACLAIGAVFISQAVLHAHHDFKRALLASAGEVQTRRLEQDVPVDSVAGPASEPGNAAVLYLAAVNSWNERRLPFLQNRKLNPFADEPMPNAVEIHLMRAGATCRDCDFYIRSNGVPALLFSQFPGKKLWPMQPQSDPYATRPYINIMRLVAQGVLNAGKKLERAGGRAEYERDYRTVIRFGWHLRQKPGSILDLQLGLELEQKGLHYLDVLYGATRETQKRLAVWKYGDSLKRLSEAVKRKYTQLGNPEAAMWMLREDPEPVWRVQAAAALALARDVETYGWLERRDIRAALHSARKDPDETVRRAAEVVSAPQKPITPPPPTAEATR